MTLVVDIGNTRIKWGRAESGKLVATGNALHIESMDEAFDTLLAALPEHIDRALVANVAGEVMASRLVALLLERFGVEPQFVATQSKQFGIRCGYDDPSRLGVDRWVALIAAHRLVAGAVCVIDAGTAVTFDALDAHGQHLGGLILAGPRIIANALHRGTRGIGSTADAAARPRGLDLLGRTTDEAVGHGALLGLASSLDVAAAAVAAGLDAVPAVLLTGGAAPLLQTWLETEVQFRADLVLEGLAFMAGRNG